MSCINCSAVQNSLFYPVPRLRQYVDAVFLFGEQPSLRKGAALGVRMKSHVAGLQRRPDVVSGLYVDSRCC